MVTLHCCGEVYYAEERHAGRHIKCSKCGRVLSVVLAPTISSMPAEQPPASQPRTKKRPTPNAVPAAGKVKRPHSQVPKLVLAGALLGGLVTWFAVAGLPHHHGLGQAPAVKMPVAPPVQPPASSGDAILDEIHRLGDGAPKPIVVSLPTGTWLTAPRGTKGDGILRIQNGSGLDAVVKFVSAMPPRRTVWMVYIRAHDTDTVKGVGPGSYLLRFGLGLDWDASSRIFLRNPEFYEAGKQLDFIETAESADEPGKYTDIKITLNDGPFGNLPRAPINDLIFGEGDSPN
jgi:hypothetical protein